jgi:large subunit ribosomal protein L15
MKLNELRDNPGAAKKKRIGRGPARARARWAAAASRARARARASPSTAFEGGQMPIYMRLPKRGFNSLNPKRYAVINLNTLQRAIERGALKADGAIDETVLVARPASCAAPGTA